MLFDGEDLRRRARAEFRIDLRIAWADRAVEDGQLTPGERQIVGRMAAPRAEQWRLGRAALKTLLVGLNESGDTAALRFPHPRLSLSHSGGRAVAVGINDPGEAGEWDRLRGLGVDLEVHRSMRPAGARFFLTTDEQAWLAARGDGAEQSGTLLRLWTIKEALFKADPGNAGCRLGQYRLQDPAAPAGRAIGPDHVEMRYISLESQGNQLAIATSHE